MNPEDFHRGQLRSPDQWRRRVYLTMALMVFTALQAWAALVVLTTVRLDGAAEFALLLAVSGSLVAVLHGWRWVVKLDRSHRGTDRPTTVVGGKWY